MNWIQGKRKEITNNYENAKQLNRLNQSRVHPKFTCSMLDVCVHVHKHKNGFSTFYIDYATEIFINFFISVCVCVLVHFFFYCSFTLQSQFSCNSESTIRDEFYCEWTHTYKYVYTNYTRVSKVSSFTQTTLVICCSIFSLWLLFLFRIRINRFNKTWALNFGSLELGECDLCISQMNGSAVG